MVRRLLRADVAADQTALFGAEGRLADLHPGHLHAVAASRD
jgi:hypothetical protein